MIKRFTLLASLLMLATMAAMAARVPRPLFDIIFDGPNGTRFRPAEAKGKIRLIALFTSTCDHCAKTMAILNRVEPQYKARGVQFYGALVGGYAAQDLADYLKKVKPVFPLGMLTKENTTRLADFKEEDRPFAPILIFVNKSNVVEYQFFGNEGADSEILIKGMLDKMLQAK